MKCTVESVCFIFWGFLLTLPKKAQLEHSDTIIKDFLNSEIQPNLTENCQIFATFSHSKIPKMAVYGLPWKFSDYCLFFVFCLFLYLSRPFCENCFDPSRLYLLQVTGLIVIIRINILIFLLDCLSVCIF